MPYRPEDSFSWETIDRPIRTRRIIAALVLVAAGWGVGFFAGRMSAWIFPVTRPDTPAMAAVQNKSPTRPVQATVQTSPQPVSSQTPRSDKTSPTATATTAGTEPGKMPSTENDRQAESAPSETADEFPGQRIRPAGQGFALVNPNWEQERPRARQRDAAFIDPRDRDDDYGRAGLRGSQADVAACERRYTSFRRSDGTYQPYGRNSRELCPMLR